MAVGDPSLRSPGSEDISAYQFGLGSWSLEAVCKETSFSKAASFLFNFSALKLSKLVLGFQK